MNISQIGLLVDIAGVLLLFKYGLPSDYIHDTVSGGHLILDENSADEQKELESKNRMIKLMAYTGLIFLIVGFILQFIGSASK